MIILTSFKEANWIAEKLNISKENIYSVARWQPIRFFKHPKFKKEWTYVRPALIGKGKINKDKERIYTT